MIRKRPHESGFTLIEMLVAAVVMIAGIFSVLAIFPQSLRMTRNSGRTSVINHLTSQQVEYLRSIDYTHTDLATGTHPTVATDSAGDFYYPVSGFPEEFSMRWTVAAGPTDSSGAAEADMKTVTIETTYLIRYDSGGNRIANPEGLQIVFQTYIAE